MGDPSHKNVPLILSPQLRGCAYGQKWLLPSPQLSFVSESPTVGLCGGGTTIRVRSESCCCPPEGGAQVGTFIYLTHCPLNILSLYILDRYFQGPLTWTTQTPEILEFRETDKPLPSSLVPFLCFLLLVVPTFSQF